MKAAGHPSRWKADVGKQIYTLFIKSTLRVLTLAMCFFLVFTCSDATKSISADEYHFDKIDFAWHYNNQSYGGLVLVNSGKAIIYKYFQDSLYLLDTVFTDSLLNQIDLLIRQIPVAYSCLDHLYDSTSTFKFSDSPMAMIEIHFDGTRKSSRCFITAFPGENRLVSAPPENHVLNFFFALNSQLRLRATLAGVQPSSAALDTLNTIRPLPPLLDTMKFIVPGE
jgi:hypothetical protein